MKEKLKKIGAFVAVAGMALAGPAKEASSFFEPGRIAVGCNYWASHAGVYMWRDWRPQQVEKDLDLMAAHGMTVLRVFPLWPDFQPIVRDCRASGTFVDHLQVDGPLKNYAAVDDEMMSRFRFLCDAAEKRGVKLIVGLITGWMSGRMFIPSAFENLNVLTDPSAIMWESRFVRYFIKRVKALKDFAEELHIPFDFVILTREPFKSSFDKAEFGALPIEIKDSENTVSFSEATDVLSRAGHAAQAADSVTYYLFSKRPESVSPLEAISKLKNHLGCLI